MGKKQSTSSKPIDIAKEGPLNWRTLQQQNGYMYDTPESLGLPSVGEFTPMPTWAYTYEGEEQSPFMQQTTRLGNRDYLGNSIWDPQEVSTDQLENLSDIRAENQPWYSKLINGIGKAGVLAGTTALETVGLLYGAGHSLLETAGVIEDNGKSWIQDLWDNPITNALQKVTEASEEYMPNYYTRDEQENPFSNIFTANFLGDKLLKNLGFMVGAFYGGIPLSYGIGKIGTSAVKSARAASLAERAGMARATRDIYREANLISDAAERQAFIDGRLAAKGLTEAERGKKIADGLDKINQIAQTTRATTQTIGALGSAINEGAIEALNNSKDWARMATQQEDQRYQAELEEELGKIDTALGGTEVAESAKLQKRMELAAKHERQLAEIEKGRASMGNADLLLNIPILMASNMYQLGKLYTRGFDSTRRQMGSLWNGHRLSGELAKGTLKSDKTWKGALGTALLKSNTEGLEEYLQRAASDGAGNAVNESLKRFFDAGQSEEAKTDTDDFIAGFGKAIADNLGDPNAWEEYMIGALSSMVGMPVFGSQTKNAYMNIGPVGFAGGLYGNYKDYMDARDHENKVAEYLNTHVQDYQNFRRGPEESIADYLHRRVNDPKFKALYQYLKVENDYDKWLQEQLEEGDKSKYKDLEAEDFYRFLNAAASSGHLEEFKQLVGYNTEYSDEELEDIVKQTTREITPEQQRKADEDRKNYLEGAIQTALSNNEDALVEDYSKELEEVNKRLEEGNYQSKLDGPFIDRNGQMNVTDPDKMREILNRNRENLLQGIDDYLKIRNDIDIESDGRLEDKDLELLTMMRGHILDYDKRSVEMLNDILPNLRKSKESFDEWKKQNDDKIERYQKIYDDAKRHWENVKNSKSSEEHKKKVEKKLYNAETKLKEAKEDGSQYETALELLDWILEKHETSAIERVAEAKGHGDNMIERVKARFNIEAKRDINADELLMRLSNPRNTNAISPNVTNLWNIVAMTSGLDNATKFRVATEIADLGRLANKKLEYNSKIREFLGDPSKINEAYQQAQDRVSQKEKDNKSEELALNIQNASSMSDLDRIMREAYQVNRDIAKAAMDKAKQSADESTKKFIADYEKAVNFYYGDVAKQSQKLSPEIAARVMGTAESEWENALQEGVDVYDRFVDGMNEAAEELDKAGTPEAKETAAGIRQVLSDLSAARTSLATNKTTKKPAAANKTPEGFAALQEKLNAKRAGKPEGETPSTDTKETLQNAVEQEVRNSKQKKGTYKIDSLSKLSKELKDRIQKYNEENPGSEFMVDFEQLLQNLVDGDIVDDTTGFSRDDISKVEGDDEAPTDDKIQGEESEKSKEMKRNQRVTFRSDYPTEFRIYAGDEGGIPIDYRVPYIPTIESLKKWHPEMTDRQLQSLKERLEAIQKLLQDYKAYHFVDKNYLGYIARALDVEGKNVPIYLLRSTDDTINSDKSNPITFLAIKFDDAAEEAIRKYGFGGSNKANFSSEINPVHINGERYHIVGVMTLNGQVAPEVSQAFASLQGELNKELNPQLDEARDNGQPFVVSKLTTEIDTINTGRLEKRNDEEDNGDNVSLYDFVATQQGDNTRSTSSEWDPLHDGTERNGMDFYFGTVINNDLNAVQDDVVRSHWEEPNQTWMDHHNGAIVMFVPKADGKFYPVRVTRRTVGEWLEKTADGTNTGEQLIAKLLDGSISNEYLGNIINYLKDIYSEDSTISTKMNAKMMLQKYFIFGKESPIHFNNGEVTFQLEAEKPQDLTSDSFEEFVTKFFEALTKDADGRSRDIKFSLPAESIESVKGRDVIKSGAFEIGLRGFYNFNANFNVRAIDGTGTDITSQVRIADDDHFTGGSNVRPENHEYDFGDGLKIYTVTLDSTESYYKVTYANGDPVPTDVYNMISIIETARAGGYPTAIQYLVEQQYGVDSKVGSFILQEVGEAYNNLWIIPGEGKQYIYKRGDSKVYEIIPGDDKAQGNLYLSAVRGVLSDFAQKNMDKINKLKKVGKSEDSEQTSMVAIPTTQGGTRDVPGVKVSKRDIKVGDIIGYSGPETEDIINYGTVETIDGNDIVLGGAILPTGRTYYRLDMSSKPQTLAPTAPIVPSTPTGGASPKMFIGKTLDDMNAKNGGLEEVLATHKKSPIVKDVFTSLQKAESIGKPIDQAMIASSIIAILNVGKKDEEKDLSKEEKKKIRESLKSNLIHEIECG